MAKKTNPALIGGFVVGAIALTVLAIALWGSRALFERKYEYVCYFPGSVLGLNRGAPVKFRGVDIGVVKDIRIQFRQPSEDRRIPVFVELWGKRLHELGGREPNPAMLRELADQGLRARLDSTSFVTGVMYVSLDVIPDSPISYAEMPGPGAIPEIPTLPTEFQEATKAVNQILANLSKADFKGMTDSVAGAMNGVGELAGSDQLHGAVEELQPLLSSAQRLTKTLNVQANKAGEVVDEVHGAVGALVETLDTTKGAISPQAPLSVDLSMAVTDVDKAAVAVRELADFLRRNPHAIVAGTKQRRPGQ
jgi:paraquat-inducible protein B